MESALTQSSWAPAMAEDGQALLDVESPPTQDTTVASTAPCSISRRVMCGMAWTLFSVCLLGWAVIFFMPTTETGRSDEVGCASFFLLSGFPCVLNHADSWTS